MIDNLDKISAAVIECLTHLHPKIKRYWGDKAAIHIKSDGSHVTLIDKLVEDELTNLFNKIDSKAYFLGEETYPQTLGSEQDLLKHDYIVVVDPIDGTREYTEGKPEFGSLVGIFERQGDLFIPRFGLAYRPIISEQQPESHLGRFYVTSENGVEMISVAKDQHGHLVRSITPLTLSLKSETPPRVIIPKLPQKTSTTGIKLPSAASVIDLLCPLVGSADAVICKARIWDFAGPLALAISAGLKVFNLETKMEISSFRIQDFEHQDQLEKWKLLTPIIVCKADALSAIK